VKPGTVATLMLTLHLKRRMSEGHPSQRTVSLEECDRRITYWSQQAQQRIEFAASLMEGLKP
jgi:hypothetical protein